jgi:hypothetical protein
MSRSTRPTYKTKNWPAYNEELKRRGSLTIRFDQEMSWQAAPSGKRGRQPVRRQGKAIRRRHQEPSHPA